MKRIQQQKSFKHLSDIWKDYVAVDPDHFSEYAFAELENRITNRSEVNRKVLVAALLGQYGNSVTPNQKQAILSLEDKNTFTVTTGHQLCLFGGPLFFLYKIISAINLAEELKKKFPAKNFVPVFWMATEDHDLEEIASVSVFGKQFTWNTRQSGAVGRMNTEGINELLAEIETLKGSFSHAGEILEKLKSIYQNKNLAAATREFVNYLFGEYGLICIDGDDAELKKLLIPVMQKEILEQPVQHIVKKSIAELLAKGFEPQVNPREINFFYLSEQSRKRIVQTGPDLFEEFDGTKKWSRTELNNEIQHSPQNFSPNVILRPLYQEIILPDLAYIGGPGELSYWVQLPQVFHFFNTSFPVLIPRSSVLLIEQNSKDRLEKMGFEIADLDKSADELIKKFIAENSGEEINLSADKKALESLFLSIAQKTAARDGSLEASVKAELQKEIKFLENLEARLIKAEKQKHETSVKQIQTIKEKYFPGNSPQERVECAIPYLWKYNRSFIAGLKQELNPTSLAGNVLLLDS